MKLIRFGEAGAEKPGVELKNGKWVDVSGFCADFDETFFKNQGIENLQDWLKEHNQNPLDYEIIFHKKPAPPGSKEVIVIEIELKRKDGEPVDSWLQEQANLHA